MTVTYMLHFTIRDKGKNIVILFLLEVRHVDFTEKMFEENK